MCSPHHFTARKKKPSCGRPTGLKRKNYMYRLGAAKLNYLALVTASKGANASLAMLVYSSPSFVD